MYQSSFHHSRPRPSRGYFLPFLSIIILGLIVVLVFQIVTYFQEKRNQALENKAAVEVVTGRAEMKIWGVPDWTAALDGSILREGDAIRTAPGSRVVLALLNGSVIRLGSDAELELTALKSRDGQDDASLALKKGQIWVKHSPRESVQASFTVATSNMEVRSAGTVFAVRAGEKESVHVIEGHVNVSIENEQFDVAFGQELVVGANELAMLRDKKQIELRTLLSDEFRQSEWFIWNRKQDSSSGPIVTVEEAVKKEGEVISLLPPAPVAEITPVITELKAPVVTSPTEAERKVRANTVFISGTTDAATEKIEVTIYIAGKAESYMLQKYIPGSKTWSYVASQQYANLLPGENRYTIVAIGKDGLRSSPAEITIFYDKPKEPADLSAPKVVSFNGSASSETTEEVVKVDGTIGKGIVKIIVNDFALTQYVPDSGAWSYYAKVAYGNLKEGENMYEVYGIDNEGNKTPVVKFKIVKKPKPAEPSTQAEAPL